MKKLLLLLLLPFVGFAQDMKLDHSYIDPAGFVVGDTITVKFNTVDWNNANSTPSLIQYDFQYNNKLLQLVDYTWAVKNNGTNSTAQTAWSEWVGYSFSPHTGTTESLLSDQYAQWTMGNASYGVDADWNVVRVTIQDGQAILHAEPLVTVRFIIKNKNGTNYSNYAETTRLSWARAQDNSTSTNYEVHGMSMNVDLGSVSVPTDGGITIKVNVPHTNKTDMGYSIYHNTQLDATSGYPAQGEVPQFSGNFDANGEAVLNDLFLDESYWIGIHVNQKPAWLDDVITVTDVYNVFKYAKGDNLDGTTNGWEYGIQSILGEVTNDQTVNFDDSYELLAHINGYTSSANVTSAANGAFNVHGKMDTYGVAGVNMLNKTFTPTSTDTSFTFGHGLRGDVDFSHSTVPTAAQAINANFTAKVFSSPTLFSTARSTEQEDLDISSTIEGDKVTLTVNMTKTGLVGTQLTLTFDDTILEFDSVVYDTGNTMTNFSKVNGNKLWIGSLDSNASSTVKTGTPYKVVFKTKQTIQNTIGLINYNITEGVKANGTKVKFNLQ